MIDITNALDPERAESVLEVLAQLIALKIPGAVPGGASSLPVFDSNRIQRYYPNFMNANVTNTPIHVVQGTQASTFAQPVTDLLINYCDKDCWIAPDEDSIAVNANGTQGGRIFIPAGTKWMPLPWTGTQVWMRNVVDGEMPHINLTGYAPAAGVGGIL